MKGQLRNFSAVPSLYLYFAKFRNQPVSDDEHKSRKLRILHSLRIRYSILSCVHISAYHTA